MVIGSGLLAKTFAEYKDSKEILIFASGVSNSKETNPLAFKREFDLLKATIRDNPTVKIVYFSTISITDSSVNESMYVKHKLKLENYIKNTVNKYLILRVSNVVGAQGNPNTIINYLVSAVKEERPITIWNKAERNIIDVEDVCFIVDSLLNRKMTNVMVNIAVRESVLVKNILSKIEFFLDKKAQVTYIDKGNLLPITVYEITTELKSIELKSGLGEDYIYGLLKKYY